MLSINEDLTEENSSNILDEFKKVENQKLDPDRNIMQLNYFLDLHY